MERFTVRLSHRPAPGAPGLSAFAEQGSFKGYAIRFGAPIDCYPPTKIERGAFANTLRNRTQPVVILWQHDTHDPIGRPTKLTEDSTGLYVEFALDLGVPSADRAALQLELGTISGLSIGFDPIRWEMRKDAGGKEWRHLTEVKLYEFSVVTFPAEPTAGVEASLQTRIDRFQDEYREFVADEARRRVVSWVDDEILAMREREVASMLGDLGVPSFHRRGL